MIAILSPRPERLEQALVGEQFDVFDSISAVPHDTDLVVSYGYRQIVREPHLSRFAGRLVNLHISLLPWNRGADPNFWSWYEHTPKGVSIHFIDAGIDTGPLLGQRMVTFHGKHTLRSSYDILCAEIEQLFEEHFPIIKGGRYILQPQCGNGSFHRVSDKAGIWARLPLGYDTPCGLIEDMGADAAASAAALSSWNDEAQSPLP